MNRDLTQPLLDCFLQTVKDWIVRVELNRHNYTIDIINPNTEILGGVTIKYNNKELINLILIRSIRSQFNNTISCSCRVQIRFVSSKDKIPEKDPVKTIYINDQTFETNHLFDGKTKKLIEVLEYVLPTRSEAVVKALTHLFKVEPQDIVLDSYQKRYIIKRPYLLKNWEKPTHPKRFYKYVSLQVFHNMLKTRSFRINSIVCQSDETESLYFGNIICQEFTN